MEGPLEGPLGVDPWVRVSGMMIAIWVGMDSLMTRPLGFAPFAAALAVASLVFTASASLFMGPGDGRAEGTWSVAGVSEDVRASMRDGDAGEPWCEFDEVGFRTGEARGQAMNWYGCDLPRERAQQSSFAGYGLGAVQGALGLSSYVEMRAAHGPIVVPELASNSELYRLGLRAGDELVGVDGIGEGELEVEVVRLRRGEELRQHVYDIE